MELKEVYQNGFTPGNLKFMRGILEQAFKNIESTTGVKISIGNIRFDPKKFRTTLEAVLPKQGEEAFSAQELLFKKGLKSDGWKYGLGEKDFGKKAMHKGHVHILLGISPASRKYPIIVKREYDGQVIKMTGGLAKLWKTENKN